MLFRSSHIVNKNRPRHVRGPFIIDNVTLLAASGSKVKWGCPYGTYLLSPQSTGSIIQRLYNRYGIRGPSYKTVWNVGRPKSIASIGFDPGAGRARRAIQIHCSPAGKSSGCIVMDEDNFQAFVHLASGKNNMSIEVAPVDSPGGVEFRIIQTGPIDAV